MVKLKEIAINLAMLAGLIIASATRNVGNVFIFLGLYLAYLSSKLDKVKTPTIYKYLGILTFVFGLVWSIKLGSLPLSLGWGSVFLTLIITNLGEWEHAKIY